MSIQEKNLQSLWSSWVKKTLKESPKKFGEKSQIWELKICKQKRLLKSRLEEHQLYNLIEASTGHGSYHKISDMSLGLKPWDCQLIKNSEASVVVVFYKPRKPKEFIIIPVDRWVSFFKSAKHKSITEDEAKFIAKDVITL